MSDIVDRLRGIYRVPITDGLGPAGGDEPDNANYFFVRAFPTAPIQVEAADEIDRLRRVVAFEWAPIKTAPRDGTAILVCSAWTMADGVYRIGWVADGYLDGEHWCFGSFDLDAEEYSFPTHWMPLPPPPRPSRDHAE